jgi:hypothetical protein
MRAAGIGLRNCQHFRVQARSRHCWSLLVAPNRTVPHATEKVGLLYPAEKRVHEFEKATIRLLRHGDSSRLARSAAFNASLPCGTGGSFVARIFSITRSIK